MSINKIIIGVLAGVAAGSVLGVLYAPDSGKSTRRRIINKGQAYMADVEEKMNDYVTELNEKMENLKSEFTEWRAHRKSEIENLIEKEVPLTVKSK